MGDGGAVVLSLGIWFVLALIQGLIGRALGRTRSRGTLGFWLGFCLGWIGWLIVLVVFRKPKRIPISTDHQFNDAQIAGVSAYFRANAGLPDALPGSPLPPP